MSKNPGSVAKGSISTSSCLHASSIYQSLHIGLKIAISGPMCKAMGRPVAYFTNIIFLTSLNEFAPPDNGWICVTQK